MLGLAVLGVAVSAVMPSLNGGSVTEFKACD